MKIVYLLILGLLLAGTSVTAKTPDGVTPAEEDVCDILKGGTPGLYGLCVAYCEAQDLDEVDPSSVAMSKIALLDNYKKKMRPSDPTMPCLNPDPEDCPCFTYDEALAVGMHAGLWYCEDLREQTLQSGQWVERYIDFFAVGPNIRSDGWPLFQAYASAAKSGGPPASLLECFYQHWDIAAGDPIGRSWYGLPSDEEDVQLYEACTYSLELVELNSGAACENYWYCHTRGGLGAPEVDGRTVTVNGYLVNDPPEECVNKAPVGRVDWYWGDGLTDVFYPKPDGYVYPFPNSHEYGEAGSYFFFVYVYGYDDQLLDALFNAVNIP